MIYWIVIAVLVIAGIVAIKLSHLRHRVFIVFLILLALFLYSSIGVVVEDNDINMRSAEGVVKGLKVYSLWLANGFKNMKALAGRAIEMDWTLNNRSFFGGE